MSFTPKIQDVRETEYQTMILGPWDGDPKDWTFPILPTIELGHTKVFPPRATLGPPDANVDDTLTVLTFKDLTGGQGINTINPTTDLNAFWWGTADTRWADGWTIAPEAIATRPATYAGNCTPIGRIGDGMYALWGTQIHQWDPDAQTWSNSLDTVGTVVNTSGIVVFNDTAFFPLGSTGYSYVKESSSRTLGAVTIVTGVAAPTSNEPEPVSSPRVWAFAVHQQMLYALTTDADGAYLARSVGGFTDTWFWIYRAQDPGFLKMSVGLDPRLLINWMRPDGQKALWAFTRSGALIFNDTEPSWEETNLWDVPPHPNFARDVIPWRPGEALWVTSGGGDLLQYTTSNVGQPAQGPGGRRDGMPADRRGDIVALASDLANMYVLIQGDIVEGDETSMIEDTMGADALSLPTPASSSSVLANTGTGFHPLWETSDPAGACTNIVVADSLNDDNATDYRVFWGVGPDCWSMPCRLTLYSSRQGRKRGLDRFARESYIEFGEFDHGTMATKKLWSHASVHMRDASSIEYVEFSYRTDEDDDNTWHTHETIANTPNARTVMPFNISDDGRWAKGFSSYWIKPYLRLVGNGGTTSPTIRAFSISYLPLQQDSAHQLYVIPLPVEVDERTGQTREQIINKLETLLRRGPGGEEQFLVQKLGVRTYRSVVSGLSTTEVAGHDRAGVANLSVIQIPTGAGLPFLGED